MSFELECTGGSMPGKRFPVSEEKPKVFRIFRAGEEAGTVEIALQDGQAVITNRSPRTVLVNGIERTRFVLCNGDLVAIGKDTFLVHSDELSEGQVTQTINLPDLKQALADMAPAPSSRKTQPSPATPTAGGKPSTTSGRRPLAAAPVPHPTPSPEKDETRISYANPPQPVAKATAPVPATDAAARQRKHISASQLTAVPAAGGPGLLKKVQSVFTGRNDRQQLEALQQERETLLADAGRAVLSGDVLGLSENVLASILAGRPTVVAPGEVARTSLEQWRSARDRLVQVNAEIAALRQTMGLGPDPAALPVAGRVSMRGQDRSREERTFAVLDGMQTEAIDQAPPDLRPPPKQVEAKVSGPRRPIHARRTR
jgi:hypothetical protein